MSYRLLCLSMIYLSVLPLRAQVGSGLNMTLGAGPSYFFNDPSLSRRIDHTRCAGINYIVSNKNQHLAFNPGLSVQTNQYGSKIKEDLFAEIDQHLIALTLDMLLKLNKRAYLRTGLFFNNMISSSVNMVSKYNGSGVFYYGSTELEKEYYPANLQAGVTLGLSFPFKLFKRYQKFNIKYVQYASSVVKHDYILSKAMIGKETKVLSAKARPAMLIVGLDINFKRLKKKKEEEE